MKERNTDNRSREYHYFSWDLTCFVIDSFCFTRNFSFGYDFYGPVELLYRFDEKSVLIFCVSSFEVRDNYCVFFVYGLSSYGGQRTRKQLSWISVNCAILISVK